MGRSKDLNYIRRWRSERTSKLRDDGNATTSKFVFFVSCRWYTLNTGTHRAKKAFFGRGNLLRWWVVQYGVE